MVRKKFDEDFYSEITILFNRDPNKIKMFFASAFDEGIITKEFPTYIHTLLSAGCIIKKYWQDVIESAMTTVKEDEIFKADDDGLYKLLMGMLYLYADEAKLLEKEKETDMGGVDGRDRNGLGYTVDDEPVKSWDEYFYNVARQAARNSKCFSRRIGAVLVKDNTIISTGYNGPPRGIPTCDMRWKIDATFIEKYADTVPEDTETKGKCPRYVLGAKSGEKMHLCPAGHAEENTILNCARLGISTRDTTMYMTCGMPCSKCWVKIINAGVKEIVITSYAIYDESTKFLMDNSNVKVRLFDFLT